MLIRAAILSFSLLLLVPGAAFASLADEQRQGGELAAQLRSGAATCDDLSNEDFDHVGEYVMRRFLGSTAAHQAMNDRMRAMMGDQGEQRMHQLLGRRYAGCSGTAGASPGGGMGPGMMGGYNGNGDGGWGPMMRSGDMNWMMGGNWRAMKRQDWQRLQRQWLGTKAGGNGTDRWSVMAIVAVTLGATLLVALAVIILRRRPSSRPPASASP